MEVIQVHKIGDEFMVTCPACSHEIILNHRESSAILCTKCGVELHQKEDVMKNEKIELPLVIIEYKNKKICKIMSPSDPLFYLNTSECIDENIVAVMEGELLINMQRLVDMLITHPDFFPCLDVAIDSTPKERNIDRLLMKAKKQPEN